MTTRTKTDLELIEDTFGSDWYDDVDLVGYLMSGAEKMRWTTIVAFHEAHDHDSPYKTGESCVVSMWAGYRFIRCHARTLEDALFKCVAKACKKVNRRNK